MAICIDFDGVIADTCAAKRAWLLQRFGFVPGRGGLARSALLPVMGDFAYKSMQQAVDLVPVADVVPIPRCLGVLRRLAETSDLHLISARPLSRMGWAMRWLDAWGVLDVFQSVQTSWGETKGEVADRLRARVLIDNDVRHLNALRPEILPILLGVSHTSGLGGVFVAGCWDEIETLLRERVHRAEHRGS